MESRNLTMMMTDIKGFTQRTSKMSRDEIEALLHNHEQILTPIFAEFNGTVVKTIGDAFLVTYTSASQALEAGMKVQRSLAAHNARADDDDQLLVRVVLNAGEVNLRDGDVFGEPVNVTARIEGIAEACHVTFSETVCQYINKDGYAIEEVGEFKLKGIPNPVQLYRMVPDWFIPGEKGEKAADVTAPPEPKPSASIGWRLPVVGLVVITLALGVWHHLGKPDPMGDLRRLAAAGKMEEAIAGGERLLAGAPGNKELVALVRKLRIDLFEHHRKRRQWDKALDQTEKLLARVRADAEVTGLTVACGQAAVKKLLEAKDFQGATAIVGRVEALCPKNDSVAALRRDVGVAALSHAYDKAMAVRAEGAGQAIKVLRANRFGKRLKELRREGVTSPWMDFLESRELMLGIAHRAAADFRYSGEERNVPRMLTLYAKALEADPTLRKRKEAFEDLVTLLKVLKVDESSAFTNNTQRLRRCLVTHFAWAADRMLPLAARGPDPKDGKRCDELSYFLRHNTRAVLDRLGHGGRIDKQRFLRLDIKFLTETTDSGNSWTKRLTKAVSEIATGSDSGLKAEAEAGLRKLLRQRSLGQAGTAYKLLATMGVNSDGDDLWIAKVRLDHYYSMLADWRTRGKRREWPEKEILQHLSTIGQNASAPVKEQAVVFLKAFRVRILTAFPKAKGEVDKALARLGK